MCTIDAVGSYPDIPHEEGLSELRKRLKSQKEKYVSTETITDLAELVLKITHLHSEKRRLSKNGRPLLVPNFHLHIAFCLWQNWKKI